MRDLRFASRVRPSAALLAAALVATVLAWPRESLATAGTEPVAEQQAAEPQADTIDLGALADAEPEAAPPGEPGEEAEGEAGAAVQELEEGSGVRVALICTNCNQASLTVNGVTGSDHVQVMFDDAPAVGGLGTVYALTQFPAELIGYTKVERGPGSVHAGSGGMGGTIAFHPVARTTTPRSFARLELGAWGTRSLKLAGAKRWGPVGALVALQGTEGQAVDANGDGWNQVAEFERATVHGIFDFHLTDEHVLGVSYLHYGEDQLDGPGRPQRNPRTFAEEDVFFNWHQYGVSWAWDGGTGSRVSLRVNQSRRFQQQVSPLPFQPPDFAYQHVEDRRDFARLQGQVPVGRAGLVTWGGGYQRTNIEWFNDGAAYERFVDDGLEHWEAFAEYSVGLGAHWDVGAGLRYDDLTVFGRWREWEDEPWNEDPSHGSSFLLPRLRAHWRPHDKVVLGLATGRFATGPLPVAEKTCCGHEIERTLDIPIESAWSHQVQVEIHPTPDMRLTATLFRTDFHDYIQRVVRNSTLGVPQFGLEAVARARVQGLDLVHDLRFRENRFNAGWTFTYASSEDGAGRDLPYLARHAASAYLRYDDAARGTKASFDIRWSGPVRHYQLSAAGGPYLPPVGWMESEDFTTADVSFEQRLGRKGWSIQAGITNLTDYVMSDLDRKDGNGNGVDDIYERCYDWGPITGRYGWVAAKWSR